MKYSPHLNHIRSFEAAARHLSFTLAATELNYTQSAISNHVRCLEDFIGRPLFIRHPRSLTLTTLGEAYLPSVQQALKQIDQATETIISSKHGKKVAVSCPISLAQSWMAKSIGRFQEHYPDINITVHGTLWADVEPTVSDIRITINHKDDIPAATTPLWDEKLTIVCAPDYAPRGKPLTEAADLQTANLIHILGRSSYWQSVIDHFDLRGMTLEGGLQTNVSNVALEFAAQGLGCCAVPKSLAQTYISSGRLIAPLEFDLDCAWAYYLSGEDPSMSASGKLFRNWLKQDKSA